MIILDDEDARLVARGLCLTVTGVLGLLLLGKEAGVLNSIRKEVDGLVAGGFYISPILYRNVISRASES